MNKWDIFRDVYAKQLPEIMAAGKDKFIYPYFIDWTKHFTPIEQEAWQSIRQCNVPLYPQFPVLNYFIDFADPVRRIGLEMDGNKWHDPEKDAKRDKRLEENGWMIFRVPGYEAYTKFQDPFEKYERHDKEESQRNIENWLLHSSDGLIFAIKKVFFSERDKWYQQCVKTLGLHCTTKFMTPFERDYLKSIGKGASVYWQPIA